MSINDEHRKFDAFIKKTEPHFFLLKLGMRTDIQIIG